MLWHEYQTLGVQLLTNGRKLLQFSLPFNELLSLLEYTECLLSQVDQVPAVSILTSINTLKTALISNKLLRHPDIAIQVAVVSCLGEIIRITAPDPPFCDKIMQDIFPSIISSFAFLTSTSINLYATAIRILETMANAKCCLIMLDLDCERTIIDMFQHFLVALNGSHLANVFTSIETIMTLTLEESDNIPLNLITLLLDSVQNKHREDSPIKFSVVERLFKNCVDTIKPHLSRVIKSLGVCLHDYSTVLSSIVTEFESCEQCIVSPIVTTFVTDTHNIDTIEKLPKAIPSKSGISGILDLMPTRLYDSHVEFVLVFPQLHEIPQVATFSTAITQLHILPIDIRMLSTNYRHALLVNHSVDNVPKFHAKLRCQITINHEIFELTFDVQYMLEYPIANYYTLLRVSLIRFPKNVRKNFLDHSYTDFRFDWPSHFNESYIFNTEELFTNQGPFELSMLRSFFSTGQPTMLDPYAAHYAQSNERVEDELHECLFFGVQHRYLIRWRDRPPWPNHTLGNKLQFSLLSSIEFRYLVLTKDRPPW